MEDQTYKPLNFLSVLKFLYRWKYYFAIVLLITGVVTGIAVSPLVTTPKYESEALFYPTNIGSLSKNLLDETTGKEFNYMDIGGEDEIEQYLEILQSMKIKNHIRDKFNLFEHYNIDRDKKGAYHKFDNKYYSNIEFSKTQFMAIEVTVQDEDPEMAAKITNEIVSSLDSFLNEMKQKKALKALTIVQKTYENQKRRISEVTDSLQTLGSRGIFDWQQQTRALIENYGRARIANNQAFAEETQNQLKEFGKYGPILHELSHIHKANADRLSMLRERYLKIKADAEEKLSHIYWLKKGYASDKVASPNRLLVMVVALLGVFLMACVVFSFIDNYGRFKQALNEE